MTTWASVRGELEALGLHVDFWGVEHMAPWCLLTVHGDLEQGETGHLTFEGDPVHIGRWRRTLDEGLEFKRKETIALFEAIERWRDGQTPNARGPWKMLQATITAKGWHARVWQDVKIDDMEPMQLWGDPLVTTAVLMRRNGERVGLVYAHPPKEKT